MAVYLTGDTHGNATGELRRFSSKRFFEGSSLTENDFVIILGDFGLAFNPVPTPEELYWLAWLSGKPWTTLFVDGNHENFDLLEALPKKAVFRGEAGVIDSNFPGNPKMAKPIFHLRRWNAYELCGKTFLAMGGAESSDREWRKEGKDWWASEITSAEDVEKGLATLRRMGNSVDFVISHTCPSSEIRNVFGDWLRAETKFDSVSDRLEAIKETAEFWRWYFGHFHREVSAGKFECLYGSVKKVVR